jgi:hypothetical protein
VSRPEALPWAGNHTPPPRLQKSADVLGAKPRQLVPVVLCLFVLDPTHDRLFLQRSCDPRTTHARKVSKFPLSRRLWGELSWREPDARRSRLSCTSGRGPTARIGMGRSRCWRHRVGPLVVAGVHGRRLMTTSTCARTVLRRWTWSCSRIGRGLTCTPTPGARRVCGTGLRLIGVRLAASTSPGAEGTHRRVDTHPRFARRSDDPTKPLAVSWD